MTDDEVARLVKAREDALAGCPISNVPTGELPREEGVAAAPSLSAAEARSLPHIGKVQLAHSLKDLARDYVFFTHALLFTHAGFQADPVEEWMVTNDCVGAVFAVQFAERLFSGLRIGDPQHRDHYNHLLMGCERPVWAKLYPYLNTLMLADPGRKRYVTTFVHEGRMPDPKLWVRGSDPAPFVIPFHPVGVSASDGLYHLESYAGFLPPPFFRKMPPRRNPVDYLPRLRVSPAEDKVTQMAAAVFGERS